MRKEDPNAWWNGLRHHGVLVSPLVLEDWFPKGPHLVEDRAVDKLRAEYYRFVSDPSKLRPFLDVLLQEFLGHTGPSWRKEQNIPDRFKHKGKKPHRVLLNEGREHDARFLVLIDEERVADDDGTPRRLGLHGGRKVYAELLRLMRASDVPLGILTNGHHVRLVYAGLDHESWTEWSIDAWFQGGEGRHALHGFSSLLGVKTLPPDAGGKNALLERIKESRDRQADLSHVMGTQVREGVEILLEHLADVPAEQRAAVFEPLDKLGLSKEERLTALYQGAIRCAMRLVVCLYAEARGLLPYTDDPDRRHSADHAIYYQSYSADGLYQLLKQAALDGHDEAMRTMRSAWPRLLGLWNAIHDGSPHKDLTIPAYGGQLFRPYSADPKDPVLAAIRVLEDPRVEVHDWSIYRVLEKLRVGKYKVGRKWVSGPVDFSDLRTEYIGMMYEGLLDYDLRQAREDDGGIVFLSIGDQPALPLNVLEPQSDADLKKLIKEQGKKKSQAPDVGEDADEDAEIATADAEVPEDAPDEAAEDDGGALDEELALGDEERFEARSHAWARRAVELGELFGCTKAKLAKMDVPQRQKALDEAARKLVLKAVPPGGLYLVRWSGTRKGSGTFYTKPGLAVPTTIRTLEPLVYDNHEDRENRIPKKPDKILAVKVCDPAMGSGSFLVAALRFLTQVLKESYDVHVLPRIEAGEKVTDLGAAAEGLLTERILPARADGRDEGVESALRRAVVEHCIHGVDLNPLAVELGKLSLWIETMDPTLRFTFLDHKIKCGNSLIGAWRHQAHIYPLAAWDRQLGDGAQNPRTKRAKKIRKDLVLPELKVWLDGWELKDVPGKARKTKYKPVDAQTSLFGGRAQQVQLEPPESSARLERVATQTTFAQVDDETPWEDYQALVVSKLDDIHKEADPRSKEELYHEVIDSEAYRRRKHELDSWCAVWFWPITQDEDAPLDAEPILGPQQFYGQQSEEVRRVVDDIAAKHRFLHWELEYPDVFGEARFGFDAVVGNPPWETAKPQDNEFFTKYDPAYRTYGKQEGLRRQKELFDANPAILAEFWDYQEWYKAQSNYVRNCHDLGDSRPSGKAYQDKWLALAAGSKVHPSGMVTPYAYQGSGDLNLYKLFTERGLASLRRGGRLGMLMPSGLFTDNGTRDLREAMFLRAHWAWIWSFENRQGIFPIHRQFKFAAIIVVAGVPPGTTSCRFFVHDVETWAAATPQQAIQLSNEVIRELSPRNFTPPEVTSPRDSEILLRLTRNSILLADANAKYGTDFHLTSDSALFLHVTEAPARNWHLDVAGNARTHGDDVVARPLLEGRHIGIHQVGQHGYVDGTGRSAKWRRIRWPDCKIEPQYLIPETACPKSADAPRVGIMDVTTATAGRSILAAVMPPHPCGNSVGTLSPRSGKMEDALQLAGVLGSYVLDFVAKFKLPYLHANWFVLAELPLPRDIDSPNQALVSAVASLTAWHDWPFETDPVQRLLTMEEIDLMVGSRYGLTGDDMHWILRPDNPDPRNLWRDYRERLKVLEAAGHRGKWYTLEEAREIRRKAGMGVDF